MTERKQHLPDSMASITPERFDPSLRDLLAILWQRRGAAALTFVLVLIMLLTGIANWRGDYRAVAEIGFAQDGQIAESLTPITSQEIETAIAEIKGQETLATALSVLRGQEIPLTEAEKGVGVFGQIAEIIARRTDKKISGDPETEGILLLRAGLDAVRVGNAAVIEVAFTSKQPKTAQQALLAIVDSYLWLREDRHRTNIRRELSEAELQFETAQAELSALERDLAALESVEGILDADESVRMLDRIYALDDQAEKLDQEVVSLRLAREIRNNAKNIDDLLAISDVASHPVVRQISAQLEARKQEFVVLDQRYGPKHPVMQGKQRELDDLRSELDAVVSSVADQMDIAFDGAEEKLRLINAQRDSWEHRMALRNTSVQGLTALSRSVAMAHANLQDIGHQVQLLRHEMSAFQSDASILLTPAVPTATEFPAKRDLAMLAIMIALFSAVVTALLRHYFDQSIDDGFDPQMALGIPLFARIPDQSGLGKAENITTAHDEAAGHLAVLMRIMVQGRYTETHNYSHGQVIALGSALSGDGKSHIAHAVAEKLSGLGASVIVLNADLHDPIPPNLMQYDRKNNADLIDVMSGIVTLEDALGGQDENYGYQYLGARMSVPGSIATGLIDGQLPDLIKRLRARFDHVIVDTPPILSVADGVIVLGLADVRLFILRCGCSKRRDIAQALSQLRAASIIPDGIVLNSVQPRAAYGKMQPAMTPKEQTT